MKWLYKEDAPADGDTRERQVFAWTLTRVGDYVVWLEAYKVFERYLVPWNGRGYWEETGRDVFHWSHD